jgi:hypothetical protein
MDPSDPRAFGYVYNTTDGRHQFWAIKTEGFAQTVVLALKDLFEEAYKQMNNSDEVKAQQDQITSNPVSLNKETESLQVKINRIENYLQDFFRSHLQIFLLCSYHNLRNRLLKRHKEQQYVYYFIVDLLSMYTLVDISF